MSERIRITYDATPTGAQFHADDAFVRGVMGPVRSGKSTMMSIEVFRRACEQAAQADGLRRTRWAVIRNTYRELEDTTLKTWLMWFPPEYGFGRMNLNSMTYGLEFGEVRSEVLFRALDRPDHVRKLLSLELTGAWVNEAREIPKAVIDAVGDRVGQYPAKKDGGCSWWGVMMDTNPPDEDHWWYALAEVERPEGWRFFRQPGGLVERGGEFVANPAAENLENLSEGADYYLRRLAGKAKAYVRVYYCGQYGFVIDGMPVHPDYVDAIHCAAEPLAPIKGMPIIIGLDFGLTPAAALVQKLLFGRYRIIDELTATNMGAKRFARELRTYLAENYRGFRFRIAGDPAGDERAQTDEETVYQVLAAEGIEAEPVFTNDVTIRREALAEPLRRLVDGKPAVELSPRCRMIRKGLAGGFCYRRKLVSGSQELYHSEPEKNLYSHPVEALEYAFMAAGEGHKVIEHEDHGRHYPERAEVEYDELGA
jgi:hypothetical protein